MLVYLSAGNIALFDFHLVDRRAALDVSIQWPAGNGAAGAVLEKLADEKLMARFQKGRLHAFEILFARHRNGVFRFILRFTRNREEKEASASQRGSRPEGERGDQTSGEVIDVPTEKPTAEGANEATSE